MRTDDEVKINRLTKRTEADASVRTAQLSNSNNYESDFPWCVNERKKRVKRKEGRKGREGERGREEKATVDQR